MFKWYCAINTYGLARYAQMIAVAAQSARQNSNLQMNLLFDGDPCPFIEKLSNIGVNVIYTQVSFLDDILASNVGSGYEPLVARGAYLRFMIPSVEKSAEFVLYTDVDVIWRRPYDLNIRPVIFAACPEIDTGQELPMVYEPVFNSGVMLLNVLSFGRQLVDLIEFSKSHGFYFHGNTGYYDQGALNHFFKDRWEVLPAELNARPFLPLSENPILSHFHGIKPYEIERISRGLLDDISESAIKTYNWNPAEYANILREFRNLIPNWWWSLETVVKGDYYGVSKEHEC